MPNATGGMRSGQPSVRVLDPRDLRRPSGPREQHAAGHPAEVGEAALDVRARGDVVEVEAVADREDEQSGGEQPPCSPRLPAGDGERPDDERHEDQIRERVREVRRHRSGRAAERVDDSGKDDRGADRADCERADHAVEPEPAAKRSHPRAQEQHDRRVGEWIKEEVAEVCERRRRRARVVADRDRPDGVAGAPRHHRKAHEDPREAVAPQDDPAREARAPAAKTMLSKTQSLRNARRPPLKWNVNSSAQSASVAVTASRTGVAWRRDVSCRMREGSTQSGAAPSPFLLT